MDIHCVRSVLFRSFSGSYFTAFGLNTGVYGVNLERGKIRARKTPNTDILCAVITKRILLIRYFKTSQTFYCPLIWMFHSTNIETELTAYVKELLD